MTTKERLHKLIDELPDTPETERRLDDAEHVLHSNGVSDDDAMLLGHDAAIERLRADPEQWAAWQAETAALDGTLADGLSGQ